MPWWTAVKDALGEARLRRTASAPPADSTETPVQAPLPVAQRTSRPGAPEAWAVLPAVQRALAEPITPAAPLAAFTSGLASYQDPSFLAPLSHAVDPDAGGGIVNGLADLAPGHPQSYRGSADLSVRTAPARSVSTPAVQRTALTGDSWISMDEVAEGAPGSTAAPAPSVRWEHPYAPAVAEAVVPGVSGTGAPDAPLTVAAPSARPPAGATAAPTAPTLGSVTPSVQRQASSPAGGSRLADTAASGPATEHRLAHSTAESNAPVATPSGSAGSEGTTSSLAPLIVARSVPTSSTAGSVQRYAITPDLPLRELPVVPAMRASPAATIQRKAATEPQAPLSSFAAAISSLPRGGARDDSHDESHDDLDHSGSSPAAAPIPGGEPTVARTELDSLPVARSPIATGSIDGASASAVAAELTTAPTRRDGGTTGTEIGLIGSRGLTTRLEQLSSATPAPPPVQRISYVDVAPRTPAAQHPTPRSGSADSSGRESQALAVPRTGASGSADPDSWEPETAALTVSRAEISAAPGTEPTRLAPAPEKSAGSAGSEADAIPLGSPLHTVSLDRPTPQGTAGPAPISSSSPPAVVSSTQVVASPVPIAQRQQTGRARPSHHEPGPAVSFATMFADPAASAELGYTSVALPGAESAVPVQRFSVPGTPELPRMPTAPSMPSVPDLPGVPSVPDVPGVPTVPSMPTVPSLPGMPVVPSMPTVPGMPDLPGSPDTPQLPGVPQLPTLPGSPASVSGLVERAREASESALGGASDVIGGAAGAGAAAVQQATGALGGAAAAAGNAASGADLDEMARRLFEPLSARLRTELWLDRERAGMVTDGRP